MTTGLTMPAQSVMVSLADPFTTPDWTDLTPLIKKWGGKVRGRQHELQRFNAGTVNLTLNNQDGRFSAWNTNGPYYNLLSANDASQDASLGSWAALLHCVVTLATAPVVLDGPSCVQIKANSATSPMSAAAGLPKLYAVTVGNQYTSMVSCLTAVTTRTITPTITWYKADGTTVVSTSSGSTFTDNTTTWTKGTVVSSTAPALAAFASVGVSIASQANNEIHYACRAALFNAVGAVPNTAWAPGQRGLVPTRPVKITATWSSTPYPIFYGYVDSWVPQYGIVKSEMTISATDAMKLLSLRYMDNSAYGAEVLSSSPTAYYHLGDPAGSSTAADASGNGHTANVIGTEYAFGTTGCQLTSDDTALGIPNNSGAYLQPPALTAGNGQWTFETWAVMSEGDTLFEWRTAISAGNLYVVWIAVINGQIALVYGSSGTSGTIALHAGPVVNDGAFHQVAVVVPAGSNTNVWVVTVDGVRIGTTSASGFTWNSTAGTASYYGVVNIGALSTYNVASGATSTSVKRIVGCPWG